MKLPLISNSSVLDNSWNLTLGVTDGLQYEWWALFLPKASVRSNFLSDKYLTKLRAVKMQAETQIGRCVAFLTAVQYQPKPSTADIIVELPK